MKMNLLVLATLVVTSVIASAFAADETKEARKSDVAFKSYTLKKNGDLFRETVAGTDCQVTSNVTDFKISQHPSDAAVAYYLQAGNLVALHTVKTNSDVRKLVKGDCPKKDAKVIMANVEKYTVVSNTDTTIVNMAVTKYGEFTAWENVSPVLTLKNIATYVNNECFGTKKSFTSYVAFAINTNGFVYKIKGDKPQDSKVTAKTYSSLKQFKDAENVCK
jgi:hypothetical protein